jgi:putative endonuclease
VPYFVYLLECADGTLYTGWTTDLTKRVAVHAEGKGARYTRGRLPVRLVYWEEVDSRSGALRREAVLRRKRRPQKQALIADMTAGHEAARAAPTTMRGREGAPGG